MAKILAVDDSPSMRKMVHTTLMSGGHDVILADDGEHALKMANSENVELVITDVYMPNLDGISLVQKLREIESYKYIPMLMLTTESSNEMKMKGKHAGATGWIVKPFVPKSLLATIDKVL